MNIFFSALERYNLVASTDTLWREMDSCIEKLKYRMFQSNSHKVTIPKIRTQRKFPDRNVKVLPENIGEMLLKQGKIMSSKQLAQTLKKVHETNKTVSLLIIICEICLSSRVHFYNLGIEHKKINVLIK